jgi:hypothetical protein
MIRYTNSIEKLEQNDIKTWQTDEFTKRDVFSLEADTEDSPEKETTDDFDMGDDMGSDENDWGNEGDWGDEGGDDFGGGDFGGGSDTSSSGGGDDGVGVHKLDINKGSSLNTFTQINQKQYLIKELNNLYDSINNTIDQYNSMFADWSELDQLRDLAEIVGKERNAFIMQQNPENIIKLRLYQRQYDTLVRKIAALTIESSK